MLEQFEHPTVLLVAALLCLPTLFPIVRFVFGDFETFKEEAGLHYEHDRTLWLLGVARVDKYFFFKLIAILLAYALVTLAAYQLICRVYF